MSFRPDEVANAVGCLALAGVVAALAFADGGFFAESWGPGALALSALAAVAVLLRGQLMVSRAEAVAMVALTAVVAWTALSAVWSDAPLKSIEEAERTLVYVTGLFAAIVVVPPRAVGAFLGALTAAVGAVAGYALVDRIVGGEVVDPTQDTLLFEPLGYANALAILAVIGLLLALGFAAEGRPIAVRGAAGAVALALLGALTLTGSRGAWIALAVGLVVAAALARRAPYLIAVVAVLGATALVAIAEAPSRAALAAGDRPEYWRVAWRQYEANPVLGSGAGTFDRYWLESLPIPRSVRDAHSLYLESLAELGPLGLALLLVALAVPLAVAIRARRPPLLAATSGAYVAFLVHAGLDWDWEMPAVTLAGVFCGGALLVATRPEGRRWELGPSEAAAGPVGSVLLVVLAAVVLVRHA
jgi:O-antigen ligase